MRKYIAPLLIAATLAAPGAAFAASAATPTPKPASAATADQSVSGVIKSVDLKARTLALTDGKTYQLPANYTSPTLKVGEKVTVHWKMNGSTMEVTSVALG